MFGSLSSLVLLTALAAASSAEEANYPVRRDLHNLHQGERGKRQWPRPPPRGSREFCWKLKFGQSQSSRRWGFKSSHRPEEPGLSREAFEEIKSTGLFDYSGTFPYKTFPAVDEDGNPTGWLQHIFESGLPGPPTGPVCASGAPFSVFTRAGDPEKLLVILDGGGACYQDFFNCVFAVIKDRSPPFPNRGLNSDRDDNPFKDYSAVFIPNCDGSVFVGDNAVLDPAWATYLQEQFNITSNPGVRFHYGVRNLSAGLDVAKALFGGATQLVIYGGSSGGVGAQVHAPFLARNLFGNNVNLFVLNDAGPVVQSLEDKDTLLARANDWALSKYIPPSLDLNLLEDQYGLEYILYRLENDSTVKEAFLGTDGDLTNRFFNGDTIGIDFRSDYRELIEYGHGEAHCAFPNRYKRFILTDDISHSLVYETFPPASESVNLPDPFFTKTADDGGVSVVLNEWVGAFVMCQHGHHHHACRKWIDIVEDYEDIFPNAEAQALLALSLIGRGDLAPGTEVCTKCWCVHDGDLDDIHDCPRLGNREYYDDDVIEKFAALTLVGDKPTFDPPGCQPFPLLGQTCETPPTLGENAVCAFIYDTNTCEERTSYRMKTYENAWHAKRDGAVITHEGDCGVCSSAQDLAVNMNQTLGPQSALCGANLAPLATDPTNPLAIPKTIACFVGLGFSLDCATLWTYNALNSLAPCIDVCFDTASGQPTVGLPNDPDTCTLNECFQCDENFSGAIFAQYSGRTRRRSGIMTVTLRECESVANIGQDPCAIARRPPTGGKKKKKKKGY